MSRLHAYIRDKAAAGRDEVTVYNVLEHEYDEEGGNSMALSNEMHRLTQGFLAAHKGRTAMVAAIRDNTVQQLSGFRAPHESMAVEQRQRLADGRTRLASDVRTMRGDLADYVDGLRDNVAKMLESFDTAHQSMAADQRQCLDAGRTRLASDVRKMRGDLADYVDGLRDNVTKMLESLDTAHQSMAVEQRRRLAEFGAAHQSMAVEQRQRLADYMYGLRDNVAKTRGDLADYVDGLRDNVTKMLESLDTAHQSMAAELGQILGSLYADRSEARKILNDFATVMRERRAKKSGIPSSKAGVAKAVKVRPAAARPPITVAEAPVPHVIEAVMPDDLTTITGIGAGRQQRLNEMGIFTFAQLAGSRPQEILKALGASGRLANVEQWIEEARKLSSAPGDSE